MEKPTCEQAFNEELGESVYRDDDPSWRHGNYVTEVFFRKSDNTYWQFDYRQSGDGEYNGLRENEAHITQVEPYEATVTYYRAVKTDD